MCIKTTKINLYLNKTYFNSDYADKLMQGIDEAVHRQYNLHHQQEGHQEDSNIKTHHAALQEFLESLKSKEEPQHNHGLNKIYKVVYKCY